VDNIGKRLNRLFEGQSVRGVARECEISETALRSYLKKNVIPSADKAARLAEYFDVDLEWLVTGQQSERAGVVPEEGQDGRMSAVPIPYYQDIYASAGFGNDVVSTKCEQVLMPANILPYSARSFSVINVTGDSMSPTLRPNEKIVVDTAVNNYGESGIYVLRWDGCLYVKRLEKEPRGPLHIISDNPHSPSWKLEPLEDTQEDFAILGRVIMKFQDF